MHRGAIVGLGNVALNGHWPAWAQNKNFEIAAGVDASAERREIFQKLAPNLPVFASLDQCDLPLDFVDVSTPPHTHFPLVESALKKNLHVLCEKPLVLDEGNLSALEALAREKGKVLMTVHNWRYAPICRKIEEIARGGALGNIKTCAWYVLRSGPAVTTDPNNWRLDPAKAGGGILIDHGWHAFYLVLHWMGGVPASVSSQLEKRQYENLGVEDTAKIKIDFEPQNGSAASAEIFLTWASRVRRNWGVIEGDRAILRIEDDSLKIEPHGGGAAEAFQFEAPLSHGSHHPDWFGGVIEEFQKELTDAKACGNNLKMAKMCLSLIERSKSSSDKGALVNLA